MERMRVHTHCGRARASIHAQEHKHAQAHTCTSRHAQHMWTHAQARKHTCTSKAYSQWCEFVLFILEVEARVLCVCVHVCIGVLWYIVALYLLCFGWAMFSVRLPNVWNGGLVNWGSHTIFHNAVMAVHTKRKLCQLASSQEHTSCFTRLLLIQGVW